MSTSGGTARSGLDHTTIDELHELGGDELAAQIIGTYLSEARADIGSLRQAAEAGDPAALEQAVHRLSSSSAGGRRGQGVGLRRGVSRLEPGRYERGASEILRAMGVA